MPRSSKPDGDTLTAAACRKRALDLLARREHSRKELETKLRARAFPPETIAEALDALEQSGALAAGRFTRSFVSTRIGRGQGPARIRLELSARGIPEATAREALAADDRDWVTEARRARAKRFGTAPPENRSEWARQARFLQYRGYTTEQIKAALDLSGDSD